MPETPPRQNGSEPEGEGGARTERTRILFAAGALGAFAALTGIVLLATGGGEDAPDPDPAPTACIEKWNDEESALSDGRHASGFHGYERTQVAYLDEDGEVHGETPAAGASCAVIFASNGLDSEPDFAVRSLIDGTWRGVAAIVGNSRLAELQAGAFDGANATLHSDGTLSAGYSEEG